MKDTKPLLFPAHFPAIQRGELHTLQVNLGYRCNLSCVHCHVNAGPSRTESMSPDTIETVKAFIEAQAITSLDLTGGAPELNTGFRDLVRFARARNIEVIDRCNLTILFEPGQEDLAEFLAEQQVNVTASLPCYLEENVSKQRGKGVYATSIEALQKLNALGFGQRDELKLNLVYNPVGPSLPPPQHDLAEDYKRELYNNFGIVFNDLYTITNMPINRFGSVLLSQGQFDEYMSLLQENFSAANLDTVMCRNLISVDWQGYVYDCDFNQMLDLPMQRSEVLEASSQYNVAGDRALAIASDVARVHLSELMLTDLNGRQIAVANHCYACTAGQGSSCGGALND